MIVWNPFAVGGVLAMLLSWTLAVLILRNGRGRMQSKLLAFLLIVEGTWTGTAAGALYAMEHERAAYWMQLIGVYAANATPLAYLLFMGTLDTPARRLLGTTPTRIAVLVFLLVILIDLVRRPDEVILNMFRPSYALWEGNLGDTGFAHRLFPWTLALGLMLAVWAWWRTDRGSVARNRAAIVVLAFAVRDILWLILTVVVSKRMALDPPNLWAEVYIQGHGIATGLFALLLAYGILRHQVLDIDLKIKMALEKSTLLAIVAGSIFLASEVIEQLLDVDRLVPAILMAAIVTVSLRPLQHLAARLADIVMPDVQDTPAYRTMRSRAVYQAALDAAQEDGEITEKELRILTTLAHRLGIDPEEVRLEPARPKS